MRHRDLAHLDVPVPGELVPHHLDWAADHVRLVGRLAVGLPPGPPPPLGRHARQHARLGGADGRGADGVGRIGRMPEVGQHVHAAPLDLRGLRILVLVDHVLVDRQRHQGEKLRLLPRLAERGQVLPGVAIEHQLVRHHLERLPRLLYPPGGTGTWVPAWSGRARRTRSPPVAADCVALVQWHGQHLLDRGAPPIRRGLRSSGRSGCPILTGADPVITLAGGSAASGHVLSWNDGADQMGCVHARDRIAESAKAGSAPFVTFVDHVRPDGVRSSLGVPPPPQAPAGRRLPARRGGHRGRGAGGSPSCSPWDRCYLLSAPSPGTPALSGPAGTQ